MQNRDWERFGEDIKKIIQDAVEYGNYDRLNQTISNTVNQAANWVSKNMTSPNNAQKHVYQAASYETPKYEVSKKRTNELCVVNTSGKVVPILFITFGFGLAAASFTISILGMIGAFFAGAISGGFITFAVGLLITVGFILMAVQGIAGLNRVSRFKKYVKVIGNAEFCEIKTLASAVKRNAQYVLKDIEKMIHKGWFLEGHLDKQKTCLIVTDEMYDQYKQLEQRKENQRVEEEKVKAAQAESRKGMSPEVQKVVDQGEYYIKKIRECNDRIPGEEISAKIDRIEMVVAKIFCRVETNPAVVNDIRKLMEYYLPTTVKLLEAYAEMDEQPVSGANIENAKLEIEATLDTLNVAFEKLLDSLFQDTAWDVSSDISVLNTMLAQEGLKDDGLKK